MYIKLTTKQKLAFIGCKKLNAPLRRTSPSWMREIQDYGSSDNSGGNYDENV